MILGFILFTFIMICGIMFCMNIEVINKKYSDELKSRCEEARADSFLKFITETDENNISILDLIANVEDVLRNKRGKPFRKTNFSQDEIIHGVKCFYLHYFPKKADEVIQILDGKHEYFFDKDGKSTVRIAKANENEKVFSAVGHRGRDKFLTFDVYLRGNANDMVVMAHELAHAISAHHKEAVKSIRAGKSDKEIDAITKNKTFDNDCIGEIESHIIERLFVRYLFLNGVYSKEDLNNYNNFDRCELQREINLIREEADVIKALPKNFTYEDLRALVVKFETEGRKRAGDRIGKMHDDGEANSGRRFRYVVARIVSDCWLNEFDKQDETGKKQMLDNFQNYLDETHKLGLDGACEFLLNQNFNCTVEDYITNRIAENKKEMKGLID